MKVGVIVAAAGSGTRMSAEGNKIFLNLDGKPIIMHSLELFDAIEEVAEIVVVTRKVDLQNIGDLMKNISTPYQVVVGGKDRQESVYRGLKSLSGDFDWVLIHDAARPYLTGCVVRRGLVAVREYLAVGVGVPVKDTIKQVQGSFVVNTLPREELWAVQTPQIFAYNLILKAHEEAIKVGFTATDDCALVENLGQSVHMIEGDYGNLKITTPEDLPKQREFLLGFGYDVHRFTHDRPLILGGLEIPHEKGLLGHSDADVVTHAVMDAILGAMGKGDIGEHFPDTDPKYEGVSSIGLLKQVLDVLWQERLEINNVDITIIAQKPKLSPYKQSMEETLANIMQVSQARVNVKASTCEGLGFVGREEGIVVQAVVSLCSR